MSVFEDKYLNIQDKINKKVDNDVIVEDSYIKFEMSNENNKYINDVLKNLSHFTSEVNEKKFVKTREFLFQNIFKDIFLIGKRGIGKTYDIYKWIVESILDESFNLLDKQFEKDDSSSKNLSFYFGVILENHFHNQNLIDVLNDFLPDESSLKNMVLKFDIRERNKLILNVSVENGKKFKFNVDYFCGEIFYLTQPRLARNKQHKKLKFVVFDEFEKAFAKSLLDQDQNLILSDDLFINFKDIKNSLQRNKEIRFIYLGNITNLNSPIWSFMQVNDFNFDIKKIESEENNDKILVVNLIPLFTNEDMSSLFQDLTTLGIDESSLYHLEHLIDEKNKIDLDNIDESLRIIFLNNKIFYIYNNMVNLYDVELDSINKMNEIIDRKFIKEEEIKPSLDSIYKMLLRKNKFPISKEFYFLVDKQVKEIEIKPIFKEVVKQVIVYNFSNFDNANMKKLTKENKESIIKSLSKQTFIFDNIRSYLQFKEFIR